MKRSDLKLAEEEEHLENHYYNRKQQQEDKNYFFVRYKYFLAEACARYRLFL